MAPVAGILLAAGRSTRFGGNKLEAALAGRPLAHHAAAAAGGVPLMRRFAVVAGGNAPPGFTPIPNPDGGQGRSLALGLAAARLAGAEAALVMLADMPLVSSGHLERLLGRFEGPDTLAASRADGTRSPPALIGRAWFGPLELLVEDRGARTLLARAAPVDAHPDELLDVDTLPDLERVRRLLDGRS